MTLTRAAGRVTFFAMITCAALTGRCGGSKTGSPPPSPRWFRIAPVRRSCARIHSGTVTTTLPSGASQNASLTGAFDTSTNRSTVTTLGPNGALCTTSVNTYRSTADFVDEVRVIPGVSLQTSAMTTNGPACGGVASTVN